MEKLSIGQPYKKDAPNDRRIHNGNRVALFQPDSRSRKRPNKHYFPLPNLWNRLKSLSGVRCTTLAKSKKISTIIKCIYNKLPVLAILNKRKPELYERAWCITCDSQIVETQAHLTNCRGYEAKWQEIEAQVFQI